MVEATFFSEVPNVSKFRATLKADEKTFLFAFLLPLDHLVHNINLTISWLREFVIECFVARRRDNTDCASSLLRLWWPAKTLYHTGTPSIRAKIGISSEHVHDVEQLRSPQAVHWSEKSNNSIQTFQFPLSRPFYQIHVNIFCQNLSWVLILYWHVYLCDCAFNSKLWISSNACAKAYMTSLKNKDVHKTDSSWVYQQKVSFFCVPALLFVQLDFEKKIIVWYYQISKYEGC